MTVTVKNKTSTITVPRTVQRRAGFKLGDVLEFKASGGVITILPKLPTADDEYTPEQRRIIDASLAEGLADIKAGRVSRVFETHEEFIADLHKAAKKFNARKTKRPIR
jgi:bifunctional DNA-binding transcriptional regulator/antitoxin component of YhaV-PrlF toxin-antitoxin module